jgi:Flp pilus assembly protein TadG
MNALRGGRPGQTLPIFALASLFIIGVVALAVDYGFLTNQHRNLQAFTDESATAGAEKLGSYPDPTALLNARKAALIYLRDSLGLRASVPDVNTVATACNGSGFNKDLGSAGTTSCALGSTYHFSILAPGDVVGLGSSAALSRTISVRVSESVTTALAGVFSLSQSSVGAFSVAQSGPGYANYALYSDGCVNVNSSKTEIVLGDMYVNQCTLNPGTGAMCTAGEGPSNPDNPRLGGAAGDATFGPYSNLPSTPLPIQTKAGCTAALLFTGKALATGNIGKTDVEEPPPTYAPPPNIPTCTPGVTCAAAATSGSPGGNACTNGVRDALGNTPNNCFVPGAYSTIGPIANNLNPGVYHIYGDPAAACYKSTATLNLGGVTNDTSNCPAVWFSGNTLNANYADVRHSCWANPNVPASGTFSGTNCPDGLIDNPSVVADPICSPGCPGIALGPPALVGPMVANAGPCGNLDPVGVFGGTTYYVRISAYNSYGDSLTFEYNQNVLSPPKKGCLTATWTAVAGATGYHVWVGLTPNSETLYSTVAATTVTITDVPAAGARLYPVVDSSACTGFCNIPQSFQQNYGVTFVLEGKAGVCVGGINGSFPGGACRSDDTRPVVLLGPACSGTWAASPTGASDAAATTYVCPNGSVSTNDGVFTFFGPGQGTFWVGSVRAGGIFGTTGVLDLPRAFLNLDSGLYKFHVVPGQVIVHNMNINSGNALDPLIYWGQPPKPSIQVRIIQ